MFLPCPVQTLSRGCEQGSDLWWVCRNGPSSSLARAGVALHLGSTMTWLPTSGLLAAVAPAALSLSSSSGMKS